ncbi:MAG: hypothetical protein HY400_06030 [Elusimicrobia bacterium]|nr:hypothetical protein [Elusimicrobiota bacterium]
MPEKKKIRWWSVSAILILPFVLIFIPLYRSVRYEVNWRAAFSMVAVFEVVMFLAEHYSLSRGHWIYNDSRIWGVKIWGVPIEEPLIYYLFPPLFVVTLLHALRKGLQTKAGIR